MEPQKPSPPQPPTNDTQSPNLAVTEAAATLGAPALAQEASESDAPETPAAGETFKPQTGVAATGDAAEELVQTNRDTPAPAPTSVDTAETEAASPANTQPAPEIKVEPLEINSKKHGKMGAMMASIVAAALLVLTSGAAAAYYYVANKPENILKQALVNAFDASKTKTVQFSGSLAMDEPDSDMKIKATLTGATSIESGAFDVNSEVDVVVTKLILDARSTDGKTLYIRVGGLDGLSELLAGGSAEGAEAISVYGPFLESLDDQWFELNESVIGQIAGGDMPAGQELTDNGRKALVEAYGQHPFLVVKEKLADEDIKGASSHHYKVGIDAVQLKAFFATFKNSSVEELKMTDDQLQSLNEMIDDNKLDAYVVEVWIAKGSKMFSQISFKYAEAGSTLDMRLTVDSYNKPVAVEKPDGAKSILEMLGGFLSGGTDPLALPLQEAQNGISL